jgi:sterol desaturase/sphingolipid hydroxylase (fatty acid hydroxylase superfamily)
MPHYAQIFIDGYTGYYHYLVDEITRPQMHSYFWGLMCISLIIWCLEILFPYRTQQKSIRQDFWLDGFYMFFNFFIISLIGYNAISNVGVQFFADMLRAVGIDSLSVVSVAHLPTPLRWVLMLVVADFLQWNIHRLLHRIPILWQAHKLHHSVVEMGFAAHLRYHFIETLVYKSLQFVPLSLLGFGLIDFFSLHIFTIAIGHLNHANINLNYGYLKYILNSPTMHLWHHAKHIPNSPDNAQKYAYGTNFGLTLSIWDYIFGTAYTPDHTPADLPLGFDGVENYPKTFWAQMQFPFKIKK